MAADQPVDSHRDAPPVDEEDDIDIGTNETSQSTTGPEEHEPETNPRAEPIRYRSAIAVALIMVLALTALAGWLGYRPAGCG